MDRHGGTALGLTTLVLGQNESKDGTGRTTSTYPKLKQSVHSIRCSIQWHRSSDLSPQISPDIKASHI
jgi:hypothetical protein